MINIYCTQKLIAKLPVNQGLLQEGEALNHRMDDVIIDNPLSGWHGNILTIHRRQCVLLVHNKTRFPVFMIGLTKPDFASLDYLFADTLMNTLLKVDANEEQMQVAQQLLEPLFIDKTNDRSVQGTLNQMKSDFEHKLYYDDVNICLLYTSPSPRD